MRIVLITGWITTGFILLAMLIGHAGDHGLNWQIHQISSYAAGAPYDRWITAAMIAAVVSLLIIALLVEKFKALGDCGLTVFIPMLAGAAGAGLLMVANFEETAPTVAQLRKSGFNAIRVQSFHDAGLLIFFYAALILIFVLGLAAICATRRFSDRLLAVAILLLSPAAFGLMRTTWPSWLGITGPVTGLMQRTSLFCLWLAIVLTLTLISRIQRNKKGVN